MRKIIILLIICLLLPIQAEAKTVNPKKNQTITIKEGASIKVKGKLTSSNPKIAKTSKNKITGVKAGKAKITLKKKKKKIRFYVKVTHVHKYPGKGKTIAGNCKTPSYQVWTCSCGKQKKKAGRLGGHLYGEWKQTQKATCLTNSQEARVCSICGKTQTKTGAKGPHSFSPWKITKKATCQNFGQEERVCSTCKKAETRPIRGDHDFLDGACTFCGKEEDPVADYVIKNGKVIDLISGKEAQNTVIDGEYFSGGTITIPERQEKGTLEVVMEYNRESLENPITGISYYGGAFLLLERESLSKSGMVKTPFGGGQITTDYRLRPSINEDHPLFPEGDSFWALTFDRSTEDYALMINQRYVSKKHWANYFAKSISLSKEHRFKEIKVYKNKYSETTLKKHFEKTGLHPEEPETTYLSEDGLKELGSAFSFVKTNRISTWLPAQGSKPFEEPDLGIDNNIYDGLVIIKKPERLYTGYRYALSAVPYPFHINHSGVSDQYDVSWDTSDSNIADVIDGLVVTKKAGVVTITATLRGTSISDSVTIEILDKKQENIIYQVPKTYCDAEGNTFSRENGEMTTRAIYSAIEEAWEKGYNHVIFPEMDFYAKPTGSGYFVPTGMTVEFPKGSVFHMMPSDVAKKGYTYFFLGWPTWKTHTAPGASGYFYDIPKEKATVDYDEKGDICGYYCDNASIIVDRYEGEFYKENGTDPEFYEGANQYAWGCRFVNIAKNSRYCSVSLHEAYCPTGMFITMGGLTGGNEIIDSNKTDMRSFVSGRLNENGEVTEDAEWITSEIVPVTRRIDGTEIFHEYYIGQWDHNVHGSTQRFYDILWYDENQEILSMDHYHYTDETYNKPANAKYCRISIQQSELPEEGKAYVSIHPAGGSKFCEIKDTHVFHSADGLASVIGETEACWIHNNFVDADGLLSGSGWALDLEDGWAGMRGTIIENNLLRKYSYSKKAGVYRGMDSGILALSSGYNTFVISNYCGSIVQSNMNAACTHIINNSVYSMFSAISGGKATDIRAKIYAHVYNNYLGDHNILECKDANGVVYHYKNEYVPGLNKW